MKKWGILLLLLCLTLTSGRRRHPRFDLAEGLDYTLEGLDYEAIVTLDRTPYVLKLKGDSYVGIRAK